MGHWGDGTFENNAAVDWLSELGGTEDAILLISSLKDIIENRKDALWDLDKCDRALAAAEVVAILKGSGAPGLPTEVMEWVATHRSVIDADELVSLALQAIAHIRDDSELKGLVDEAYDFGRPELAEEWYNIVADLEARLND